MRENSMLVIAMLLPWMDTHLVLYTFLELHELELARTDQLHISYLALLYLKIYIILYKK